MSPDYITLCKFNCRFVKSNLLHTFSLLHPAVNLSIPMSAAHIASAINTNSILLFQEIWKRNIRISFLLFVSDSNCRSPCLKQRRKGFRIIQFTLKSLWTLGALCVYICLRYSFLRGTSPKTKRWKLALPSNTTWPTWGNTPSTRSGSPPSMRTERERTARSWLVERTVTRQQTPRRTPPSSPHRPLQSSVSLKTPAAIYAPAECVHLRRKSALFWLDRHKNDFL